MSLRLVLARHGETPANVRGVLDTRLPGPGLTELGVAQAATLAEDLSAELAGEPLVAVYASAALRARQTAAPVAARHGLDVRVLDGVHEVEVGELEGHADEESQRRFFGVLNGWLAGELDVSMPGGEDGRTAVDRFSAGVRSVADAHPDGTVLLVAHGAVLRLGVSALAVNLSGEVVVEHRLPNTGRIVLVPDPAGWRCVSWPGLDPAVLATPPA